MAIQDVIGFSGTLAGIIGVLLYASLSGSIKALKGTVSTYRDLLEAQERKIACLETSRESDSKRIEELTAEVRIRDNSAMEWSERLVEAVSRSSLCQNESCPNRVIPLPGNKLVREK